jgi:hypothetical protein
MDSLRFGTDDDRMRASVIRAEAELILNESDQACALLRNIQPKATGTLQKRVAALLAAC